MAEDFEKHFEQGPNPYSAPVAEQAWVDWRSDQVDEGFDDIETFLSPTTSVPQSTLTRLHSPIPELRIIAQHDLAGKDGHPFKTGDVEADCRPLSHDQKHIT